MNDNILKLIGAISQAPDLLNQLENSVEEIPNRSGADKKSAAADLLSSLASSQGLSFSSSDMGDLTGLLSQLSSVTNGMASDGLNLAGDLSSGTEDLASAAQAAEKPSGILGLFSSLLGGSKPKPQPVKPQASPAAQALSMLSGLNNDNVTDSSLLQLFSGFSGSQASQQTGVQSSAGGSDLLQLLSGLTGLTGASSASSASTSSSSTAKKLTSAAAVFMLLKLLSGKKGQSSGAGDSLGGVAKALKLLMKLVL